ncbi:MAG: tetratricopeptide repeat protein [Bacteroidales bacterium]|nr:tetratricopeptide repeat protein [Bacteroidales bacterium]
MEKNLEEKSTENVSFITKSEQFIENNQKAIIAVIAAVIVIVLAIFGIRKFVSEPRQERANAAIFAAEQYFAMGDFNSALYGDSTTNDQYSVGLLQVADKYSSTKAGKRAKYEAGICFLRLGQYAEAIKYLDKYNGKDQLTPVFDEMMKGDAAIEQGNTDAALKHYTKAVKMDDNPITAPFALFKAGVVYQMSGQNAKAVDCFQQVKDNYPESELAREMDGYIAYCQNAE